MKVFLLTILLVSTFSCYSQAKDTCNKEVRVAVVDTGLNLDDPRLKDHLCAFGHKNFVTEESIEDINGHGTAVTGLIEKYASDTNYCILIYKYFRQQDFGLPSQTRSTLALKKAAQDKVDIINFSSGGPAFNEEEATIIASHPEITFVLAAGNDSKNLDLSGNTFYPASLFLDNMMVIGSTLKNGLITSFSNYSKKIKYTEIGDNLLVYSPNGKESYASGTSFSAAIFSGKLVAKTSKTCNSK